MAQKFPSIKRIARALRDLNDNVEGECDVRLQVYEATEDAEYKLRWGDPSYDQDHRGYWGAGTLPGVVNGKAVRFNSQALAKELIDQAKDQYHLG